MTPAHPLPTPTIVTSPAALLALARRLESEPLIAVDTESNSLFAYREQVCLIQISTRDQDWLLDPLEVSNLEALASVFADPHIEKVFHAAEYDIMCLKRDYGFTFCNLFDTMFAARVLGLKSFGLGILLDQYFGIPVDKRYQRADWSLRPIPPDQMHYAQQDTHYLPALRDIILDLLRDADRLDEAREGFDLMAEVPAATRQFDPDGYWRIHAARDFTRRQMAILRELYLLREQLAEQRNRPPFKVITDEVLVAVVRTEPITAKELGAVPGMSYGQIERYGAKILQAVLLGQQSEMPNKPDRAPRVDPVTMARFDALHEWRKARAAERGVESDVIVPKECLWALARSAPTRVEDLSGIYGLGPWKLQHYGEALIQLLTTLNVGTDTTPVDQ